MEGRSRSEQVNDACATTHSVASKFSSARATEENGAERKDGVAWEAGIETVTALGMEGSLARTTRHVARPGRRRRMARTAMTRVPKEVQPPVPHTPRAHPITDHTVR
jgi:hypothetical protein